MFILGSFFEESNDTIEFELPMHTIRSNSTRQYGSFIDYFY